MGSKLMVSGEMMEWWQLLLIYGLPALGGVIIAYLTILPQLKKTERTAERAVYAITNGHPQPFRDDLDYKFNKIEKKIDHLMDFQVITNQRLGQVDKKLEDHLEDSVQFRRDSSKKFESLLNRMRMK